MTTITSKDLYIRGIRKQQPLVVAGTTVPPGYFDKNDPAHPEHGGILSYVMRYRDTCMDNLESLLALKEPRSYELDRIEFLRTEVNTCHRMLSMFGNQMN